MRGKFIVIEGIEGSGKSTQAKKLAEALPNSILTCEPSYGSVGMICRAVLLKQIDLNSVAFMLLFIADRIDHLENIVVPALEAGQNVVCDRYYLSNMAYQGRTEQCAPQPDTFSMLEIYEMNKRFQAITPDITIFLSLDPVKSLERVSARSSERSIFDDLQKLKRISGNFQCAIELLTQHGEKIIEVSALPGEDEIAKEILEVVLRQE